MGGFFTDRSERLKQRETVPILGSDGTQEEAGGKGDDDPGNMPNVR